MPTNDLFNNLSSVSDGAQSYDYLSTTANNGQSFTTGSVAETLSSLTVPLENLTGTATGTLTAYLYSDTLNLPVVALATIGTINNSTLSTTAYTDITISPSSTILLAANTSYYIVLEDTATKVTWDYTTGTTGTGVTNTYYTFGSTTTANSSNGQGAPWIMEVAASTICYAAGARIRTLRGDVPVEELRVGDLAVTVSGEARPIRWLGSRVLNPRLHLPPEEAMPVRIAAHALAENRPIRDLVVSPGHAIALDLLGEVLIPAGALVNGATITQEDVETVAYWHVELDSHDLLIAENQPAESYLDMGNRSFFAEDGADRAASPDGDPSQRTHAHFCRPFHQAGELLEVVQAQLRRRAAALGWRCVAAAPFDKAHLEVDGRILWPEVRGSSARFVLPADAQDVWLVSPTSVPLQVGHGADRRVLGLNLTGMTLDEGWGEPRAISLDDPLLGEGFNEVEGEAGAQWRWTAGRARLPAALWAGLTGAVFLRLEATVSLPRWVAPEAKRVAPPYLVAAA